MILDIPFDNSYARLGEAFFARQIAQSVTAPKLITVNDGLAQELGIDPATLRSDHGVAVLSGNARAAGSDPIAQAYAGHQFGNFVPQLGDGRALLLGEVVDQNGTRRDIQLKGSGRTPFSRGGDGRAWLGPVLREYILSEFMHAAGIPTTRALAAVTTGDAVMREKPYPGAILTRVASSHIRVGTFQFFAVRGMTDELRALTDYVIDRHYPDAEGALDLLRMVTARQAKLVAQWMGIGFIHGVMNTDNTQIAGETIDYGPCAFMDAYHPATVFSSIDHAGRYAYQNQPDMVVWNLAQLASSLVPLMGHENTAVKKATQIIHDFADIFRAEWLRVFRLKLGLTRDEDGDGQLIAELLNLMAEDKADFTNTFRALEGGTASDHFQNKAAFSAWHAKWLTRHAREGSPGFERMRSANPAYIPRNHRVEQAIQAALTGDYAPFHRLNAVLAQPYTEQPENADLTRPPTPSEEVRRTFCGT